MKEGGSFIGNEHTREVGQAIEQTSDTEAGIAQVGM